MDGNKMSKEMSPAALLLHDLAQDARRWRFLSSMQPPAPGQQIERLTNEKRAVLRTLTSEDARILWDWHAADPPLLTPRSRS